METPPASLIVRQDFSPLQLPLEGSANSNQTTVSGDIVPPHSREGQERSTENGGGCARRCARTGDDQRALMLKLSEADPTQFPHAKGNTCPFPPSSKPRHAPHTPGNKKKKKKNEGGCTAGRSVQSVFQQPSLTETAALKTEAGLCQSLRGKRRG